MRDHFDIENFEASITRYLSEQFTGKTWTAGGHYTAQIRGNNAPASQVCPVTENGFRYECVVAGVSGAEEPTWPTTIGDTVDDGGVTWECQLAYPVIYDESDIDFDATGKWFFVELLGSNGESVTVAPVHNLMLHIRTRGDDAAADMSAMTRQAVASLKDKEFTLYDVQDKVQIGKLRSKILREFPRETARQAKSVRGFNRSLLVQITYGRVGVVFS